jgi:hypothetical protein
MSLKKTEREVLRKWVKFVIPQISKLEIFNQKVCHEELFLISLSFYNIEGQSRTKRKCEFKGEINFNFTIGYPRL